MSFDADVADAAAFVSLVAAAFLEDRADAALEEALLALDDALEEYPCAASRAASAAVCAACAACALPGSLIIVHLDASKEPPLVCAVLQTYEPPP